jgi:hypothetical protein
MIFGRLDILVRAYWLGYTDAGVPLFIVKVPLFGVVFHCLLNLGSMIIIRAKLEAALRPNSYFCEY